MAGKSEKKLPSTVTCGNPECSLGDLSLMSYQSSYPAKHVEEERIHWRAYPRIDGSVIQCICGHYTIFYNPAEQSPPMRK